MAKVRHIPTCDCSTCVPRISLEQCAEFAQQIMDEHTIGAEADAGFDGGEFSGPAHHEMETRAITQLAERNGYTYDEVMTQIMRAAHDELMVESFDDTGAL